MAELSFTKYSRESYFEELVLVDKLDKIKGHAQNQIGHVLAARTT